MHFCIIYHVQDNVSFGRPARKAIVIITIKYNIRIIVQIIVVFFFFFLFVSVRNAFIQIILYL